MRALEESAALECRLAHLAHQANLRKDRLAADRYIDIAEEREAQAGTIWRILLSEELCTETREWPHRSGGL